MATPFRNHAVIGPIAATEDVFARFDEDVYVLSDDDGIGELFDELGHLYPCENIPDWSGAAAAAAVAGYVLNCDV